MGWQDQSCLADSGQQLRVKKPFHWGTGPKGQSGNLTLISKTPVLLLLQVSIMDVNVLRRTFTQVRNCYYYFISTNE